jgi:hypothetical protein
VGAEESLNMQENGRVKFCLYLAILETKEERARIFGQDNLLYIWSSELISAYKKVISITGDLNALSGRVNINLRL